MSEAIIAKKAELVDAVAEKMKAAASIVVVDARGLTVEQDTVLRRELRGSEVEYKVIKNSILRRAAEKAGLEDLASVFIGPSTVAFHFFPDIHFFLQLDFEKKFQVFLLLNI